jgi:hypothetical protein
MSIDRLPMKLPPQSQPVSRNPLAEERHLDGIGVQPAQNACANLTGLAAQICYATRYGIAV